MPEASFFLEVPSLVGVHADMTRRMIRCLAHPDREDFNYAGDPRFRELNEKLIETYSPADLWDSFGIVADVMVRL